MVMGVHECFSRLLILVYALWLAELDMAGRDKRACVQGADPVSGRFVHQRTCDNVHGSAVWGVWLEQVHELAQRVHVCCVARLRGGKLRVAEALGVCEPRLYILRAGSWSP